MRIDLQVDAAPLLLRLRHGEKRLAYAVVNAINKTALRIQQGVRARVRERFTVRGDFVLREAAIISPFASVGKARPFAEIRVGSKPRFLLPFFEEGAVKMAYKGKRVAVPLTGEAARPAWQQAVPQVWWVTKLGLRRQKRATAASLKRHGRVRGAIPIRVGAMGTYQIPRVGIYQRVGGPSRLIYSFETGPNLEARLGFEATARGVADVWFGEELERQAILALARG